MHEIKLPLARIYSPAEEKEALYQACSKKCGFPIKDLRIRRKSLDARDKERIAFVYNVELYRHAWQKLADEPVDVCYCHPAAGNGTSRPVIVGAGPAGLFAAWELARAGMRPLVIEQGKDVDLRRQDVELFWQKGYLDCHSNIQFGEGGAGAFSDGKLTSRSKDPLGIRAADIFIACGANPEIRYWYKPHLGSDVLPHIISVMRRRIEDMGGEFFFNAMMTGIKVRDSRLTGLTIQSALGKDLIPTECLLLSPGNGSRNTYAMLAESGVALTAKPFAVGLRIEHDQALIDRSQYGDWVGHPLLGSADYHLTSQIKERSVYTFCMCPGGYIVNAASEEETVVVNGMSLAKRDSGRANSAVVATVCPGKDFPDDPLAACNWQHNLEHLAYISGGGDYSLPVMAVEDFLEQTLSHGISSRFRPCARGFRLCNLGNLLPDELADPLRMAVSGFDRKIKGFASDAVLAGLETRTSSPVRVLRGEDRQSISVKGLYPMGEGAGYAGGIMSSAIDGLRSARAVLEQL